MIQHSIIGWKKSRGDGNCYFRAVMSRYIELLHKFYNPKSYLEEFIKIINNSLEIAYQSPSRNNDMSPFINAAVSISNFISSSLQGKNNDPVGIFLDLVKNKFQESEFDLNLVRLARLITYTTLRKHSNSPEFRNYCSDVEGPLLSVLTMGEEAEGLLLIFLPMGLDCQVIQYNFFNEISVQLFPENTSSAIKIHIVRRSGHYDMLYTIQEMEWEMFSFSTGEYHIPMPLINSN